MTYSMTAFAQAQSVTADYSLTLTLRSVNHRYCEILFKLPDCLKMRENHFRRMLQQRIKRGKIECAVTIGGGQQPLAIDQGRMRRLLDQLSVIEQQMPHPRPVSAIEVLHFPGVLIQPEADAMALQPALDQLMNEALRQLLDDRQREGEKLAELIRQRCALLAEQIEQARQIAPQALIKLRAKLEQQITRISAVPDRDRLEQELVYHAQRLDVEEELDRLTSHLEETLRLLNENLPCGRKLDFLMQEMNREANTLGAKSADTALTKISIESKVLIEQMREQIQNIE